jgi:hypothetical protein
VPLLQGRFQQVCFRGAAGGAVRGRIESMILAVLAMRVLETMFFLGLIGSAVVVLISFYEDGKELFGKDE